MRTGPDALPELAPVRISTCPLLQVLFCTGEERRSAPPTHVSSIEEEAEAEAEAEEEAAEAEAEEEKEEELPPL